MPEYRNRRQEASEPAAEPAPKPMPVPPPPSPTPARATGRRKSSIARVWLVPGKGDIVVNGKTCAAYFPRPTLQMMISQPLAVSQRSQHYDIASTVKGGGPSGQAGALRHGIARALIAGEPGLRPILKVSGFLTRDSRVVERKKYGRRKARRSFQFSKR